MWLHALCIATFRISVSGKGISFTSKNCQTVVSISMIRQFNKFLKSQFLVDFCYLAQQCVGRWHTLALFLVFEHSWKTSVMPVQCSATSPLAHWTEYFGYVQKCQFALMILIQFVQCFLYNSIAILIFLEIIVIIKIECHK